MPKFLLHFDNMSSQYFCKKNGHGITYLPCNMNICPKKHITIWKSLYCRRFTQGNGSILIWMSISSI